MMDRDATTAYVALGANLGQPASTLARAIAALNALPGSLVVRCSSLYRTTPIDSSGPDYINAVVEISTTFSAPDLLIQLQKIEQSEGRERHWRNAPRTLDLDLLLYGTATIGSATLTVPHPRMLDRAFVMVPLAEIAPDWGGLAQQAHIQNQHFERMADAV